MFDITSYSSFECAISLMTTIREKNPNVPIILCANKVDSQEREVTSGDVVAKCIEFSDYIELSSKSEFNLKKPFLKAIRIILGDDTYLVQ